MADTHEQPREPGRYEARTSPVRERLAQHGITDAAVADEAERGHSTARDTILTGAKSPAVTAAILRLLNAKGDGITALQLEDILTGMRANRASDS